MINLDFLNQKFEEQSIYKLKEIFNKANKCESEDKIKELQLDLSDVLQHEKSRSLIKWEVSPSGNNHIVVIDNLCILINIFGANILLDNWLFFDGELSVLNFQWIEKDSLVVFDVYYIVHDIWEKCICHFTHNEFFVYFAPVKKDNLFV